jgi:hypothetical protein
MSETKLVLLVKEGKYRSQDIGFGLRKLDREEGRQGEEHGKRS